MPIGLDVNDVGYARGGAIIDSPRAGKHGGGGGGAGGVDWKMRGMESVGGGEWHFHAFGDTVGLFALDVRESSSMLQVQ